MLEFQNFLLSSTSIALIPLLSFPLSFLQSWHCIMMCGPLQAHKGRLQQSSLLQGRLVSYSLAGAGFGYFGENLRTSLEYQAMGAIAYFLFIFLTLGLLGYWGLSYLKRSPRHQAHCTKELATSSTQASFLQGLLMAFIPCPILFQFFALATLTGSAIGGFLVGLAHALASSPIFWWGQKTLRKFTQWRLANLLIQFAIAILLIFNLFYFTGRLISPQEDISQKTLFCF